VSICPSLFFDEELYQWCSFLFLIFFDRSEPLITPEKFNMLQSEKKGGIWKKREKKKRQTDRKRKKKKEFLKEEPQHYIFCFSAVSCFKSGT